MTFRIFVSFLIQISSDEYMSTNYLTGSGFRHHTTVTVAVLRSRSRHFWGGAKADFFYWPEPRAGAAFFKAAPAASFWQAKRKALLSVKKQDLRAIYNGKCDQKKICINNSLLKSSK